MVHILLGLLHPAYWIQCVSAAVFSYMVLDATKDDRERPVRIAGKIVFLMLMFMAIHLLLSALTLTFRFLAGVGTWLAYMGGVLIYTLVIPDYDNNARMVYAAAASSIIITVFELGATLGGIVSNFVPGFDSLIIKAVGCLVLLISGGAMSRHRVFRYYISPHAAQLNLIACTVSAVCVMVYDLCLVNVYHMQFELGLTSIMSVVLLALFVVDMVCYHMTYHLSREYANVMKLTAENHMNKSAQSLMAVTEENLAELHKIRHDILNQYAYMQAMLASGDVEGLRAYFEELTSTFTEPVANIVDCGNHTMNLIFHMEGTKARKSGIVMDIKAATPHKLPFSDLDLVKLYSNVLDNAIEACVAEKHRAPHISVTVNVVGEYLFTKIKNPTLKGNTFLESGMSTTKEDSRIHGKGMSIVRGIVQKYDGSIRYAIENGEFIVEFMLCLRVTSNE